MIKLSNCFPPSAGKQLYYISNCQKECQERSILLGEFRSVFPSGLCVPRLSLMALSCVLTTLQHVVLGGKAVSLDTGD